MKNSRHPFFRALAGALLLSACSGGTEPLALDGISPSPLTFDAWGEEIQLTAVGGVAADLVWSVDDRSVATVSADGVLRSVANGATEVSVTDGTASVSAPVTVSAAGPVNLVMRTDFTPGAAFEAGLKAAELRWEAALGEELPDVSFESPSLPAGECHDGHPVISEVVDDVLVLLTAVRVDGAGGNIAGSYPCILRQGSNLTVVGVILVDVDDLPALTEGDVRLLISHELGHVLGLGSLWAPSGLLGDPSIEEPGADTHFSGPLAIGAFDAAGGEGYLGKKVPVENEGGIGTADRHWREGVFGDELMSTFLNREAANPMSAVTLQSLADLGYPVDLSAAEAWSLPVAAVAPGERPAGWDLRGDALEGPLFVVDPSGNLKPAARGSDAPRR